MIPAKLLEMLFKAFFNHPKVKALFKYKDEPNELDIGMRDLERKVTDDGFRITAAVDVIKGYTETIDNIFERVKEIDKVIDRFDDKLQQIDKIAHPPAIPLKEINEFRETNKNVKWIMSIFKIMKKNPLLKSIFK